MNEILFMSISCGVGTSFCMVRVWYADVSVKMNHRFTRCRLQIDMSLQVCRLTSLDQHCGATYPSLIVSVVMRFKLEE